MSTYYVIQPGLEGPFALTTLNALALPEKPGVYVLSKPGIKGDDLACYVGRSKSLRDRVPAWVGKRGYTRFYYSTTATENGAFFKECRLFHQYGKATYLDNVNHPAIPAGSGLPVCGEQGCLGESD